MPLPKAHFVTTLIYSTLCSLPTRVGPPPHIRPRKENKPLGASAMIHRHISFNYYGSHPSGSTLLKKSMKWMASLCCCFNVSFMTTLCLLLQYDFYSHPFIDAWIRLYDLSNLSDENHQLRAWDCPIGESHIPCFDCFASTESRNSK